jgi:hypothetical protein
VSGSDHKIGILSSSKDYFQEIVDEGFVKRNLKAAPQVKSYIVDMLVHYIDARNLHQEKIDEAGRPLPQTLAEQLLVAQNLDPKERVEHLRVLGDRALYIAGFFGESLQRKLVDVDYYAEMGCTAYAHLSSLIKEDTRSRLFQTFSLQFLEFVDVLTYISHRTMVTSDQNLIHLYDRYMRTGSEVARERLLELGVLTIPRIKSAIGN